MVYYDHTHQEQCLIHGCAVSVMQIKWHNLLTYKYFYHCPLKYPINSHCDINMIHLLTRSFKVICSVRQLKEDPIPRVEAAHLQPTLQH